MSVPLPLEKQRKGRGFRGEEEPVVEETENWETLDQAEGEGAIGGGWKRSIEGWIVILTNINEETTEEDIHDKFGEFGKINNLHLNLDRRTGFVKGYALLEYATYKEAKAAVATANETEFLGNKIKVDFAFVKGTSGKENKQRGSAKNSRR